MSEYEWQDIPSICNLLCQPYSTVLHTHTHTSMRVNVHIVLILSTQTIRIMYHVSLKIGSKALHKPLNFNPFMAHNA